MTSVYKHGNLEEIRKDMDARYKAGGGDAYAATLPWDVMRHHWLHSELEGLVKECLRDYSNHMKLRITDLGCGTKSSFEKPSFQDALRRFEVEATLVDLSEEAIRHLQARSEEAMHRAWGPKATFSFRSSPAEELAKVASGQHMVISVESIEHWSDVEDGLRGVHDALLPGGYFVLTTPNRDSLHVRMARKLGFEAPFCANDHTYEFGYEELDRILDGQGFDKVAESGVGLAPYWALENVIGGRLRHITDNDPEVLEWLQSMGRRCPEFSFCQVKAFQRRKS